MLVAIVVVVVVVVVAVDPCVLGGSASPSVIEGAAPGDSEHSIVKDEALAESTDTSFGSSIRDAATCDGQLHCSLFGMCVEKGIHDSSGTHFRGAQNDELVAKVLPEAYQQGDNTFTVEF